MLSLNSNPLNLLNQITKISISDFTGSKLKSIGVVMVLLQGWEDSDLLQPDPKHTKSKRRKM